MNVFTGLLLRTVLCLLAVLGCGLLVPYRLLAEEAQGTTPAVATPEVPAASPKNDGKKDAKKKPKATAADAALTSEEGAPASDPGVPAAGKKAKRGDLQSSGVTEVVVTAQKRKQRAQEVPISIGVLNAPEDLFEDEHLQARGFFVEVAEADGSKALYPGPSYMFSAFDAVPRIRAPKLGEHTAGEMAQ